MDQIPEITKERMEKSVLKKIGDFRIFQDISLGKGCFGEVFLATKHTASKTISASDPLYAAKAIAKMNIINPKDPKMKEKMAHFEEQVYKEIFILKKVQHSNIVSLIDVRSTENRFYLIFEYCSGGTLESYRKSKGEKYGHLMEAQALEITRQIAEAMNYCVSMDPPVIHRDLKPANILLEGQKVKISDFGFARLVDNQTDKLQLTTNIGSPLYMAPEVYNAEKYNFKCDVWSLGIILYELLYGRTPWNSKQQTPQDLFDNNVLKKPLVFPENISVKETTKELIKNMLQIDQDKRFDFEQVLAQLAPKTKKNITNEEDSSPNPLKKSVTQNLQLMNKHPKVENVFVNKAKKEVNEEKKTKEDQDAQLESEVYEVSAFISKEELEKNSALVFQAEDYVVYYLNIVNFLRNVFHHIKINEKNLVAIKVKKQNIPKYMLFIKKTELIVLFKIKNMMEQKMVNEFLCKEFYKTQARSQLLKRVNEDFNSSLDVFDEILEESGNFDEKSELFNNNFEFNKGFDKVFQKEFEELWKILSSEMENLAKRVKKLAMEIKICQSLDNLFQYFPFSKEENNTDQFFKLYEDLKNPEKVKNFLEKQNN